MCQVRYSSSTAELTVGLRGNGLFERHCEPGEGYISLYYFLIVNIQTALESVPLYIFKALIRIVIDCGTLSGSVPP